MSPLRVAALEPLSEQNAPEAPGRRGLDALSVGRRIRHHRQARGLTLAQLGEAVGTAQSLLSQVENGKREPRLSLIGAVADALGVPAADLLDPAPPPTRRAALEIELEQAQRSPLFRSLGLPRVSSSRKLPLDALEALVALHAELARRHDASNATPEEARRANTEIRLLLRAVDNHLPEIEEVAEDLVRAAGYTVGALTHRQVARMAHDLGFTIIHVDDLPHSTRTVTDLANGRIYLPPASIPGGHGLRSLALQAIAHRVLGHERPASYTEFLRQRLEINYFAACCLLPRSAAVEFLSAAKADKDLAVEDFRDAFGVTHEAAAHRLTNLLTSHLGIPVHFLRVGDDGALYRGYENDGVPFPQDASGAVEGQTVCRQWTARTVFEVRNRTTENYQYTDTPAGTFWCSSQTGSTEGGGFSITVGVPYAHAKWFRGRDTRVRRRSTCPDAACCRRPDVELERRWADAAWPSARLHAQTLAPLPSGRFPGVDDVEVYEFLASHAPPPGHHLTPPPDPR
ncbi:helix-turn-helix domain-containing protein [Kineococcus arenarius]|uniref:helix-turn-helix domain-containing protein n=1 Tax=unclassified Kineococcus TaxID=2621656 RepID=UPI003D7CEA0D